MDKVRISFSSRYIEITLPRIAFVNKNISFPRIRDGRVPFEMPIPSVNTRGKGLESIYFHSADDFSRGAYSNAGNRLFSRSPISCKIPTRKKLANSSPPPFFPLPPDSSLRHKSASFSRTRDSCEKLERNEK